MSVQDRGAVEISIDGRTIPGPWRAYEGGDVEADDVRIKPGHMLPSRSLGATPEVTEITCRREYKLDVIHVLAEWIEGRVGSGECTITRLFLDRNHVVFGRGVTRTATLTACRRPPYDAESNDVADLELAFSPDGP